MTDGGPTMRIHAPGRVNLIGEHTDYTGGLVLPMAIDRGITLTAARRAGSIELTSSVAPGRVEVALPFHGRADLVDPSWGAYVAAVAAELEATDGCAGHLVSDIPSGAGLSSSAALMCVVALALGFDGSPLDLARRTRAAEHVATGVPTGIMDQYCIAAARAGHAAVIDCTELSVQHVPVPDDIEVVVRFVEQRTLRSTSYRDRVDECTRAEAEIGPLRLATIDDVESIADETIRRRARHVVTENRRVREFADAMRRGDHPALGRVLREGHASLRDDFDTSTPRMNAAVAELDATEGVFGARMTGAGFGGCIVALCVPGAIRHGWVVRAVDGARVLAEDG